MSKLMRILYFEANEALINENGQSLDKLIEKAQNYLSLEEFELFKFNILNNKNYIKILSALFENIIEQGDIIRFKDNLGACFHNIHFSDMLILKKEIFYYLLKYKQDAMLEYVVKNNLYIAYEYNSGNGALSMIELARNISTEKCVNLIEIAHLAFNIFTFNSINLDQIRHIKFDNYDHILLANILGSYMQSMNSSNVNILNLNSYAKILPDSVINMFELGINFLKNENIENAYQLITKMLDIGIDFTHYLTGFTCFDLSKFVIASIDDDFEPMDMLPSLTSYLSGEDINII